MRERLPGYDVMSKRGTPSFNEATRRVLDARTAPGSPPSCRTSRTGCCADGGGRADA